MARLQRDPCPGAGMDGAEPLSRREDDLRATPRTTPARSSPSSGPPPTAAGRGDRFEPYRILFGRDDRFSPSLACRSCDPLYVRRVIAMVIRETESAGEAPAGRREIVEKSLRSSDAGDGQDGSVRRRLDARPRRSST